MILDKSSEGDLACIHADCGGFHDSWMKAVSCGLADQQQNNP
jgi:hypothetical protein